jgi:uncharacterized RDD family membrane protein YckC
VQRSTRASSGSIAVPELELAPVFRRLLSLGYEAFLLAAILLCAAVLFHMIEHLLAAPHVRALFQGYLVAVAGAYFVWQWVRGGQTLPMKTWRLRLVSQQGEPVGLPRASLRYALALVSVALCGAGFLWALVDRDRQFLHDRLAGTRIVSMP